MSATTAPTETPGASTTPGVTLNVTETAASEIKKFMTGEEGKERGPARKPYDPADADIGAARHEKWVEIVTDEHRDGRKSPQRIQLLIAMGHDADRDAP